MTGKSGRRLLILRSSVSPSIPGMLISDRITIRVGSMPPTSFSSAFSPELAKGIALGPLPHFAAEPLPEQLSDIAFVIDYQNANGHAASRAVVRRGRRIV